MAGKSCQRHEKQAVLLAGAGELSHSSHCMGLAAICSHSP
jgi:hypothetical protein